MPPERSMERFTDCVYVCVLMIAMKQVWPGFDLDGGGDGRRDGLWRNALL